MDDAVDHVSDMSRWMKYCPGHDEAPDGIRLYRPEGKVLHVTQDAEVSGIYGWSSPFFPVTPGQYYRLAMECESDAFGFWEAQFFEEGSEEPTDFYTNGYPDTCGSTRKVEGFFYGKRCTQKCRVLVWPGSSGWAEFRNIDFEMTPKGEAWGWFQDIMDETQHVVNGRDMRVIRGDQLQKVRGKLDERDESEPVDVVVYGDSVGFDIANLPLDVYLERAYPGSRVRLYTRGKGAAGWDELAQPDVLEERVIRLDPDLVLCQGVSTEPAVIEEALPSMIEDIRAQTDAEIVLMTDHRSTGVKEDDKGREYWDSCAEATRRAGEQKKCAVADLRVLMKDILDCARPPADRLRWFMRDEVCHLNDRGRAVVLRLLMNALAPDSELTRDISARGGS